QQNKEWIDQVKKDQNKGKQDDDLNPANPLLPGWRQTSVNNLKQLALALHGYHDETRNFPPTRWGGKGKTGGLSWRVAILPYIEAGDLYNKLHHNEPWDSPHNKTILDNEQMPLAFKSPRGNTDKSKTFYQVFTGPKTIWPNDKTGPLRITMITDGT